MANRVLRDWTLSDKVNSISVHAERFFTRLIMKADDYGCFFADNRLLKANLFPLLLDSIREADITRWMAECQKAGLIVIYDDKGKSYVQIVEFRQRLRTMKSRFPMPNQSQSIDGHLAADCQPESETKPETKPKPEGKGNARDFEWFRLQIDEIWTDQLPTDKKKNLEAAIQNAWEYLSAHPARLKVAEASECKQLVSKAFQFMKPEQSNGRDRKVQHTNSLVEDHIREFGSPSS
jgi:hypothetical protein